MTEAGIPRNQTAVIDTTGRKVLFPGLSRRLSIVTDAAVKMYFTQEDFDADINATTIATTYADDVRLRGVWMRTAAGSANVTLTVNVQQ